MVDKSWFEEGGRKVSHHERALTPGERRWLLAPLDPLYLSRLQPEYKGTAGPLNGFLYEVSLRKGPDWKETWFIRYSFAPCERSATGSTRCAWQSTSGPGRAGPV
jgi:hypothetical protein